MSTLRKKNKLGQKVEFHRFAKLFANHTECGSLPENTKFLSVLSNDCLTNTTSNTLTPSPSTLTNPGHLILNNFIFDLTHEAELLENSAKKN